MSAVDGEAAGRPAERRGALAVPADRRSTRSCRTATPARSSRPTAASAGSASRASTRRACSASLLDRQAGYFRLAPFGINVPSSRRYEPGTNILETTWHTPSGWVVVRDALTMGPRRSEDTITPHTRPPTDDDAEHLLVRTVRCIDGNVEVELVCEPVFDYGRVPARVGARGRRPPRRRRQRGRADDPAEHRHGARHRGQHACARGTLLTEGDELYCALSWAEGLASPADLDDANARLAQTTRFWRTWLSRARLPDHEWMTPIQRSALAIKGLTYMPTGATVAALTTSLPETPGGERNWDYRYTWMRDSTFTLQALHFLNLDWEADEFMQFIADLEPNEDGALQIMYGIDGRRDLTESTRDDLSGYAGARPVRIGNGAFDQRQNDVFGAALDSILLHTRRSKRLPRRLWPIVQAQAECATAVWREPDQGIWEARGEPQHYVSSKLMGWVALDRAAKLADIARRAGAQRDLGARPPRRSRPTSSSTASTAAACCASTTRPTRSTPRRCSPRSSASCPPTTSGCARACWPSPTS